MHAAHGTVDIGSTVYRTKSGFCWITRTAFWKAIVLRLCRIWKYFVTPLLSPGSWITVRLRNIHVTPYDIHYLRLLTWFQELTIPYFWFALPVVRIYVFMMQQHLNGSCIENFQSTLFFADFCLPSLGFRYHFQGKLVIHAPCHHRRYGAHSLSVDIIVHLISRSLFCTQWIICVDTWLSGWIFNDWIETVQVSRHSPASFAHVLIYACPQTSRIENGNFQLVTLVKQSLFHNRHPVCLIALPDSRDPTEHIFYIHIDWNDRIFKR